MSLNIILQKSTSSTYARPNDVINYNVFINNNGTIDIFNLSFQDILDSNQDFVIGSTFVNSISKPLLNPVFGFTLDDILIGATTTISYNAKIKALPTGDFATNTGALTYDYFPTITSPANTVTSFTNTVTLPIAVSNPTVTKISQSFADISNTIPITLVITNQSPPNNRDLLNTVVSDNLNSGLVFVPNSIKVNETPVGGDIVTGINIATIPLGSVTTITFNVLAPAIPFNNPISNTGSINYKYETDYISEALTNTVPSNTVNIQVNSAFLGNSLKSQNISFSDVNEEITYTISMPNDGNVAATDVIVIDTLPSGVSVVPNSVFLNNVLLPSANLDTGVNIGTIPVGTSSILVFKVIASAIPSPNPFFNVAKINFNNLVDPATLPINNSDTTNSVEQTVNSAILSPLNKIVDKSYAKLGDIITYTLFFKNTGNVTATNCIFTDIPPSSTLFVPNSLSINGVIIPGENPGNGVNLGNIPKDSAYTITFQVLVDKLPETNPITNTGNLDFSYIVGPFVTKNNSISSLIVPTTIAYADIFGSNLPKAVDSSIVDIGDIITYTITLKNTGNTTALNTVMVDTAPNGTLFVPNSVSINGTQAPSDDPNNGILLGSVPPNETVVITFAVLVVTPPSPNPIINKANITYDFVVNPSEPPATTSENTNDASTKAVFALINPTKSANPSFASVGDTITYSIVTTNTGNTTALNVKFSDIISPYVDFITGSIFIDSIANPNLNPLVGFNLPNIIPQATVTVSFKGIVTTIPPNGIATNEASIFSSHFVSSNRPLASSINNSNVTETQIRVANISGVNFRKYAPLVVSPGNTITYSLYLFNSGNTTAINIFLQDTLPTFTTFNIGSTFINGSNCLTCNPNTGFNISSIGPFSASTVTFTAVVDPSTPSGTILSNTVNLNYQYIVDPSLPAINESSQANSSTTVIDPGNGIFVEKYVNTDQSALNNILYYKIIYINGTNTLNTLVFLDTIPAFTTFVNNSLRVNNIQLPGVSPEDGILITTTPSAVINEIDFQVLITTIPSPNPIANLGSFYYTFTDTLGNPVSGSLETNTVVTYVNEPILNLNKYVDKVFADIGDEITYNIVLKNNGNLDFTDLSLKDFITLSSTSFKPNSLFIDGVNLPGVNPFETLTLPNLQISGSTTVTFTQIVEFIPTDNLVNNSCQATYSYTDLPGSVVTTSQLDSNKVTTEIRHGNILVNKYPNKAYSYVGDMLTFTSVISSTGNVSVGLVTFQDTIAAGLMFKTGSVVINGASYPSYNPEVGFSINSPLNVGDNLTIAFTVDVLTVPSPNPVTNISNITYSYIVDPTTPIVVTNTKESSVASTNITLGALLQSKAVDKTLATIGDVITYTIVTTNAGNTQTNLTILNDIIPEGVSFVPGSVIVDSVTNPSANPISGILLGTIAFGQSKTVQFKGQIISLPAINPATNTSSATFRYTISPDFPNEAYGYANSNSVFTKVDAAILDATKQVDLSVADLNSTLTYTIIFENSGNIPATNTTFLDILQNEISLIPGTLTLNGNPIVGDIYTGILLGTIPSFASNTIVFKVSVNTIPSPNLILNSGTFNYDYIYDPSLPTVNNTTNTNVVSTIINNANFTTIKKYVDKDYANIGDTITYTVAFTNLGNVVAQNVVFRDTIPNSTAFTSGSVKINNITCSSCNPGTGFALSDISPSVTTTVTFNVTVSTLPSPNPISNEGLVEYRYRLSPQLALTNGGNISNIVNTQVNSANLSITKFATKSVIDINDTVDYIIVVRNTGNIISFNNSLKDIIQSDISFVPNSVFIDGALAPFYDPSISMTLPNLSPNGVSTVSFTVTSLSIPNPNPFLNSAQASNSYIVDPSLPPITTTTISNLVRVRVNHGDFTTSKRVDKSYGVLGETLTYTIYIKNTGSATLENILLIDTVPSNTSFVANSITVNGAIQSGININNGLTLPALSPPNSYTVTFRVNVTTIPTPNVIYNNGTVNSTYRVDLSSPDKPVNKVTNTVQTIINSITSTTIVKTVDKTVATLGDFVDYTISFTITGNTTAKNLSFFDTIPNGTVFQNGTSTVNGITSPISNPQSGIVFGNLLPLQVITINFTVLITTIPTPNPTPNSGVIKYSFTLDPSLPDKTVTIPSNTVYTQVNHANLFDITKSVDKDVSDINEQITYTLTIPNFGNTDATNTYLLDILGNDAIFTAGSLYIDNVNFPSATINAPIFLGTIPANTIKTLRFSVTATKIPNPNPIPNYYLVNYYFSPSPGININDTAFSNTVYTLINSAILNINKAASKTLTTFCDVITYTISIQNNGNITATNIIFKDLIPLGTMFIPGSLKINGASSSSTPDFVYLPDLGAGAVNIITFSVKIFNCLANNTIVSNVSSATWSYQVSSDRTPVSQSINSNTVYTLVSENPYSFNKIVCPNFASVGEEITYYFSITNSFVKIMENIILSDIIPINTTFVANSLKINGFSSSMSPPEIYIGNLNPKATTNVEFKVKIISKANCEKILNSAAITFFTLIENTNLTIPLTAFSNTVFTYVNEIPNDNKSYYHYICENCSSSCNGNKLSYPCICNSCSSSCNKNNSLSISNTTITGITNKDLLLRDVSCTIKEYLLWSEFIINECIEMPCDAVEIDNINLNLEILSYSKTTKVEDSTLYNCFNETTSLKNLLIVGHLIVKIEYFNECNILSVKSEILPFGTYIPIDNEFDTFGCFNLESLIEDAYIKENCNNKLCLTASNVIYVYKKNDSLNCQNISTFTTNSSCLSPFICEAPCPLSNESSSVNYTGITSPETLSKLFCNNNTLWREALYCESLSLNNCPKNILDVNLTLTIYKTIVVKRKENCLDCCCNTQTVCMEYILFIIKPTIKIKYIDTCDKLRLEIFNPQEISTLIKLSNNQNTSVSAKLYIEDILISPNICNQIFISSIYFIITPGV